jgi:hypothetical protein
MPIDRRLRVLLACIALAVPCLPAWPQLLDEDPDWKEVDVPPPPAFNAGQLLPIEMPPHLTLKFGVDPSTIAISSDGVVRYVVVASSPGGAVNAMYEGIRCATGEFRTYARFSPSGKWMPASNATWRAMDDNAVSKHTRAFAFQGVCEGRSRTGQTAQDIARKMRGQGREQIN